VARIPVTWFEIMGPDSAALQKFYGDVFGWKLTPPVKEMGNYSMLEDDGRGAGGGIGEGEPRVSIYMETPDPQKYLDRALQSGGELLMPVTTVTPTTTIAMFKDPAGNTVGVTKTSPRASAGASASTRTAPRSRAKSATARTATARSKKTATRARKPVAKRSGTARRAKRR
jgi:predicted enzyme related to lactoylglutathione lyase